MVYGLGWLMDRVRVVVRGLKVLSILVPLASRGLEDMKKQILESCRIFRGGRSSNWLNPFPIPPTHRVRYIVNG